jgi:hypothetical protein
MLTSFECLAKAAEMDALALICIPQSQRDSYVGMARGWRRAAAMADAEEKWAALNPGH